MQFRIRLPPVPGKNFVLGLLLAGCQTPPPAPEPLERPLLVEIAHFSGSPLSGPLEVLPPDINWEDAWFVRVTVFALARLPGAESRVLPLGAQARFIASVRGGTPILASSRVGTGAGCLNLEDAAAFRSLVEAGELGPSREVLQLTGVLPEGVTSVFRAAEETAADAALSGDSRPRRVEILVHRGAEEGFPKDAAGSSPRLQVALLLEGLPRPEVREEEREARALDSKEPPADGSASPQEASRKPGAAKGAKEPEAEETERDFALSGPDLEFVLLDRRPVNERDQLALFFPSPFERGRAKAFAAVVEVTSRWQGGPDSEAERSEALARCREDLARSGKLASSSPRLPRIDTPVWPGMEAALSALSSSPGQRGTLVYLAGAASAPIAEDFVLTAGDRRIAELSTAVLKRMAQPDSPRSAESLGWILESSTLEILARLMASDQIAPELESLLVRHAGQASRDSSSLEMAIRGAKSKEELNERLAGENWIFLEDSSPAARARAFEWLAARKKAPARYDPLGATQERRAALEQAMAAQSPPPPEGPEKK